MFSYIVEISSSICLQIIIALVPLAKARVWTVDLLHRISSVLLSPAYAKEVELITNVSVNRFRSLLIT